MTLQVAITFDIEFSINGAFNDPETRRPLGRESLLCRMEGREAGLGTVLNILKKHGLKATFFVEPLQTAWFDDDEMGDVAHRIAAQGHEIQLHLHPVWLQFDNPDWAEMVKRTRPVASTHDSLLPLATDKALEIIERGKAVFERWSLPAPTAVRTGNLIMDRALYKVFAAADLTVSSSVGCGLYQPEAPELNLYAAPKQFDGVMEIPVSSYWGVDPFLRRRKRLATLLGMGRGEQRAFLGAARKAGIPLVVILSHISEFCTINDAGLPKPNVKSVEKFEQLCRNIAIAPDLEAATINQLAKKFSDDAPNEDKQLNVPRLISAARFLERT